MRDNRFEQAACPSTDVLRDFGLGLISDEQFDTIAAHLEQCSSCVDSISSIDFHMEFPGEIPDESLENEPDYLSARGCIARIPEHHAEVMPEQIAGYRVEECLGRGGMGVVYKVWDSALGRHVVVKQLRSARIASEVAIEQFKKELHVLGNLKHPAIVQAYQGGFLPDGQPYLVMEYLEGETLHELVKRTGALDEMRARGIFRDVTSGIRAMHETGLVHLDVKPANVMILADGSAKVLDLGLASYSTALDLKEVRGSLLYMSPEQARGGEIDEMADVYALGATLFFAMTGQAPLSLSASCDKDTALKAVRENPRHAVRTKNPRTSRKLAELIDRSLLSDSNRRPELAEFERVLNRGQLISKKATALVLLTFACFLFFVWAIGADKSTGGTAMHAVFHDLFQDADIEERWELRDTIGKQVSVTADSRSLVMRSAVAAKKDLDAILALAKGTNTPEFNNGRLTIKVSVDSLNTGAGALFRWDKETQSGYCIELIEGAEGRESRDIALVRIDKGRSELLARKNVDFEPDEFFRIQVQFDGPNLTACTWPDKTSKPQPQISAKDERYTKGSIGLVVHQNVFHSLGHFGAVFDDVYMEVRHK